MGHAALGLLWLLWLSVSGAAVGSFVGNDRALAHSAQPLPRLQALVHGTQGACQAHHARRPHLQGGAMVSHPPPTTGLEMYAACRADRHPCQMQGLCCRSCNTCAEQPRVWLQTLPSRRELQAWAGQQSPWLSTFRVLA